jgi:ribosomal protein S27E
MARQVIVKTWCDPCLDNGQDNEGVELPALKLPELPGRARLLALCEVHRKELYDPLVEALRLLGQPVDAEGAVVPTKTTRKKAAAPVEPTAVEPAAADGRVACPSCGESLASRTGLQAHVRRIHDTTLAVLEGRNAEDGFACPECGQVCLNPQGLGAHRSRIHGVKGKQAKA